MLQPTFICFPNPDLHPSKFRLSQSLLIFLHPHLILSIRRLGMWELSLLKAVKMDFLLEIGSLWICFTCCLVLLFPVSWFVHEHHCIPNVEVFNSYSSTLSSSTSLNRTKPNLLPLLFLLDEMKTSITSPHLLNIPHK